MGIYTNTGRHLRAETLSNTLVFWGILGKADYESNIFAWENEVLPPVEDETVVFPDVDMGVGIDGIGYRLAEIVRPVIVDDITPGPIIIGGKTWSISNDPQATHLYIKFVFEPNDFMDTVGPYGPLTAWRRFTIVANVTPPPKLSSFRYGNLRATTWSSGALYTVNQFIAPTIDNGFLYQVVIGGISSGTEPTWPDTRAFQAWTPLTAYTVGDSIVDSNGNIQQVTVIDPGSAVSGNSAPTWELLVDAQTIDFSGFSTITWVNRGVFDVTLPRIGYVSDGNVLYISTDAVSDITVRRGTVFYTHNNVKIDRLLSSNERQVIEVIMLA